MMSHPIVGYLKKKEDFDLGSWDHSLWEKPGALGKGLGSKELRPPIATRVSSKMDPSLVDPSDEYSRSQYLMAAL